MNRKTRILVCYLLLFLIGLMLGSSLVAICQADSLPPEPITVTKIVTQTVTEPSPIAYKELGEFKITYYCACPICCGKQPSDPAYGITASGNKVMPELTIAVDPKVIPLNSKVYIEGIGVRVAHDTGRLIKGNRIDVYVPNHQDALHLGTHQAEVFLFKKGGVEE